MSNYFIKEETLKKWAWGGILWQYDLWDVEEQLDSCYCMSVIQKLSCFIEQQMWHTINCVHYQPPPHPAPASTHPQIPPTWPPEYLARNYNSQSPLLLPVIMWLNSYHGDKWKLCVQLLGHLLKDVESLPWTWSLFPPCCLEMMAIRRILETTSWGWLSLSEGIPELCCGAELASIP